MENNNNNEVKVISLLEYRAKRSLKEDLSRDRQPLYENYLKNNRLKGSPHFNRPQASEDFADRLSRIKASLEKINRLMIELKKVSTDERKNAKAKQELKPHVVSITSRH